MSAHTDFIKELKALRLRAGDPKLPQLHKYSVELHQPDDGKVVVTRSTISDILTCKRTSLPTWAWVVAFLEACRVAAKVNRLDPAGLGSTAEWHARWQSAKVAAEIESGADSAATLPAGPLAATPPPGAGRPDPEGPSDAGQALRGPGRDSDEKADEETEDVTPAAPTIMQHRYRVRSRPLERPHPRRLGYTAIPAASRTRQQAPPAYRQRTSTARNQQRLTPNDPA